MKLSFDEYYNNIMFGGTWVRFCNLRKMYKGQSLKLGVGVRGRNDVLYVTLYKWVILLT